MATFLSGAAYGTWGGYTRYVTLTGTVSRSGNTVTISNMTYQFSAAGAYASGYPETIYIRSGSTNLSTTSTTWYFSGGTSPVLSLNSASFSVGVNQTSATLNLKTDNESYSIDFGVTFPSGVVAPSTPSVVGQNTDAFSNTISYATSSFGSPSSGTIYLYASTDNSNWTQIASKTTTGSSSFLHSGLLPNFTYYYRSKAVNAYAESAYSQTVTVKTKPAVYVSVEGASKAAQKGYASLNGVSKEILKIYDSDNGVSRRIY